MGNIFISHSSADNDYAQKLIGYLKHLGHESVFLDFDPDYGIPAGREWEKELYNNLRKCQVVIVLYSQSFSSSQWCFAEITYAKALGKYIIPLKINECKVNSILIGVQVIDSIANQEEAFKRLENGLLAAGINKEGWDNSRPPYPGLLAFEEKDAPVFFGREEETENILKSLRQFRNFGGPKLLLVLGASGSGKSSLMRAGVIPKLRKDKKSWIIIDPFRSLKRPFEELSKSLAKGFNQFNDNRTWQDIYDSLKIDSGNAPETGKTLSQNISDIMELSKEPHVTLLIFIDQLEELLFDNYKTGIEPSDENIIDLFLSSLRILLDSHDNKFLIISTIRSDFLGNFHQNRSLKGLTFDDFIVKPVNPESLRATITEPAKVAGIELQDGLAEVMLRDTGGSDALPLLAFTLRELWEQFGQDGVLGIEEYRNKLGGLEGSVARVAEDVLISYIAETGRGEIIQQESNENKARLDPEDEKLLKAAFMIMVRIDEEGRYARRFTKLEELPRQVTELLQKFVTARLLVMLGDGRDVKIEVAHEALFRTWKRLVKWLEEDKNFLLWRKRLNTALNEWETGGRNDSELLRGAALAEAMEWLSQYQSGKYNLISEEIQIIEASNKKDKEEKLKEEKRRVKELRMLRILISGAALVIIIICGVGYWIYKNNIKTRNELAKSYWDKSKISQERNDLMAALFYTAEGLSISEDEMLNQKMLLDIEYFLPTTFLGTILSHKDIVYRAVFSPDGKQGLTISGSTVRIWDVKTGTPIGAPIEHGGVITSAIFSPDGKWVLTASWDSTACIWDAKTGVPINALMKHNGKVNSAVFSPDARLVLTASYDKTARIWDLETGALFGAPIKHGGNVISAVFSPDGKQVLTASADSTARIWDTKTRAPIGGPMKHARGVYIAIFSPDGKKILTANGDREVRIWDAKTGLAICIPMEHNGAVLTAVFSADGKKVLTAGADRKVCIWNAETGTAFRTQIMHYEVFSSAVFSPDDKQILTASWDKTACLWDAETRAPIGTPMKHLGRVNNAVFSSDGKKILTASGDRTARIWIVKNNDDCVALKDNGYSTNAIFSPDGKKVFTTCSDSTVHIWDVNAGTSIVTPIKQVWDISNGVFSYVGKKILTISRDSTVRIWDTKSGSAIGAPMKHDYDVRSAVFSPDEKLVLTISWNGTPHVWDAKSGAGISAPLMNYGEVLSAVFSPDGKQILTASSDSTARIWDAIKGVPIGAPMIHNCSVNSAIFSPDGKLVLTTGNDRTARIWDAVTSASIGASFKHDELIKYAIFSPDGKQVLTVSYERARLWNTKTGMPIGSPMIHRDLNPVFSPDGNKVLTVFGLEVLLWDTKTGTSIGAPMLHDSFITSIVFSPDGKEVLTSSNGINRIWNIEGDLDITAQLFKLQAKAITGVELNIETGETHCIPVEEFRKLKEEYYGAGQEHYKKCKYPKNNLWRRFYSEEAKIIDLEK